MLRVLWSCRLLTNQGPSALEMNSLMHVLQKLKAAKADHLLHVSILRPMKTKSAKLRPLSLFVVKDDEKESGSESESSESEEENGKEEDGEEEENG